MTLVALYSGIGLTLIAVLVLLFLVISPPAPRVPVERRRVPGIERVSTLTRVTNRTVGVIDRALRNRRAPVLFAARLELANIRISPSGFILLVTCAAIVLGLLGVVVGGFSLWSVLLVIAFALLAPLGAKILLEVRTSSRRAAFADQLDDSLSLLSGGLRAGQSLLRSVDALSAEADSPTSDEFARVINETRVGRDIGDALDATAERMRSEDFRWVAQAIAINREVGGNLANVFDQVGTTIRERNQIRRQVKSLSAEGRLSALVLIALPVGVFLFLLLTQPTYFAGFFTSIFGIFALIGAVALLIIGALWLRVVVRVKF